MYVFKIMKQLLKVKRTTTVRNQKKYFSAQEFTVTSTNLAGLYTISLLEPSFDYQKWSGDSKKIFSLSPVYVSPAEFNYELPRANVPEIAFVGRSNVGKSSLVRALLGNDKLVRVSKEPGCTKTINYYTFLKSTGGHRLYFVDLPGYGFASVSKTERSSWIKLLDDFLTSRDFNVLRRTYVLIDARHGIKEDDIKMIDKLSKLQCASQVILTKVDLVSPDILQKVLKDLFDVIVPRKNCTCLPIVHAVSSIKGDGMQTLKYAIADVTADSKTVSAMANAEQ